jgi:deoxycytidylate deaminase
MFELAKKVSYKSPSRYKLGCVIVNKKQIVALGFNDMAKTHPKVPLRHKTLHAELHALIGTSWRDTKGCTAYVYREDRTGKKANAKPCPMCELALRQAGIKFVYYTHEDGPKAMALY